MQIPHYFPYFRTFFLLNLEGHNKAHVPKVFKRSGTLRPNPSKGTILDTLNFSVCHGDQLSNSMCFDFVYVHILKIPVSDMLEADWKRVGRDEKLMNTA